MIPLFVYQSGLDTLTNQSTPNDGGVLLVGWGSFRRVSSRTAAEQSGEGKRGGSFQGREW